MGSRDLFQPIRGLPYHILDGDSCDSSCSGSTPAFSQPDICLHGDFLPNVDYLPDDSGLLVDPPPHYESGRHDGAAQRGSGLPEEEEAEEEDEEDEDEESWC